MSLSRRQAAVIIGGAIGYAASRGIARAQAVEEVAVGIVYPFSGANAQTGIDAKHAFETALEIINSGDAPKLGLAAPGSVQSRRWRLIFADHQSDPQKGRAETERLIVQEKVAAIIGTYQSSVAATASVTAERYNVPFIAAEASAPSLSDKKLKFFFRAAPNDEFFTRTMFEFYDARSKMGAPIKSIALFYEDTLFGADSARIQRQMANDRGIEIVADIKYRNNAQSLTSEVQQLKAARPQVLMPTSYTPDAILLMKTMAELGYAPPVILAQNSGFSDEALFSAVGPQGENIISRSAFSLDLARRKPSVAKVNSLFRARAGKDLNDLTSRQFSALMVLADAVSRSKTTKPVDIREALATTELDGVYTIMPWSRVKFDETGQNHDCTPVLIQRRGNLYETIFPESFAVTPARWPAT